MWDRRIEVADGTVTSRWQLRSQIVNFELRPRSG